MKGTGLLIIGAGKAKDSGSDEESEPSAKDYLEQAWEAFKADEKDNFMSAMEGAMRRCAGKKSSDKKSSDDDEEESDHDYDD